MLLGLKELNKLERLLDNYVKENKIFKYRIYLNLDTTITVDIVGDEDNTIKDKIENSGIVNIFIDEWIEKNEYENDEYYKQLFEKKIDKEHRRRLINLIDNKEQTNKNKTPIVTFYSYKGGVGRTTSLITFANYYSYLYGKKIVILDFDFEAPGFTNYFDFSLEELENKSGVLEYILDKEASKEKLELEQNYIIEVSREYSGDGSIYVMPSGNLYGKENLASYVEALARIDINSTDTITKQILGLIDDINETINPDIILIDSRTGFHDIFGLLINRISDTIIGLFESNKQTEPGINLFLNEIYSKENNIENNIKSILVNSLVHKDSGYSKRIKEFSKKINNYLIELTDENYAPEIFDLRKSNILGNIGTIEDDRDDYFEFIKENTPNDYKKFFNKIIEVVKLHNDNQDRYTNQIELKNDNSNNQNDTQLTKSSSAINIINKNSKLRIESLKINLLKNIKDNYPENYAEDIKFNDEFLNNKFYFRKSMEDIFNFDKFLLIGTKGTGKSAFNSALKSDNFVKKLIKKADKKNLKFKIIDIVSLNDNKQNNKYFDINNLNQDKIKDKEFFYKRFWVIYILNSILLDKNKIFYKLSKDIRKLLPIKLTGTVENKNLFENIIYDDKIFRLVENELDSVNRYLKRKKTYLIITFDQLDYIVKPILWSKIISPLINYCRSMPYFQIQPKLFIRRDLFNKLTNITNKKSLDTKSINLEWSKEEIFDFFFKVIFAYGKEDFIKIIEMHNDYPANVLNQIKNQINKINCYNQIGLDQFYIEVLVNTFFGKYPKQTFAKDNANYSKSFDWFYENLSDTNGTISLRIFLDLIKFAIEKFQGKEEKYILNQPILHPDFYNNNDVRRRCITNYFEDLSNEEGNEDFKNIIEHIRDSSKFPTKYKIRKIKGDDYNSYFKYLLNNVKLNSKNINEIEEVLKINGAISIKYINNNSKELTFAFLYKYYLKLKK